MSAEHPHFVPIGVIESSAPHAALVTQLNAMRPPWRIRLTPLAVGETARKRYRVELRRDENYLTHDTGSIDVWLRVKGALMTAFPADKPNAVTVIDP